MNEIIEYRRTGGHGRHHDAPQGQIFYRSAPPDQEIELKVEDYKCIFGNHAFLKKPIHPWCGKLCGFSCGRHEMPDVFCGDRRRRGR